MFKDLLKTELLLKNVFTKEEWDDIEQKIHFRFAQDMYLEERKWFEMTRDRLDLAKDIEQYVGKYYSNEFVRKEILRQTDEDMKEQDKLIKDEESEDQYASDGDFDDGGEVAPGSKTPIGQPIPNTSKDVESGGSEESESSIENIKIAISKE